MADVCTEQVMKKSKTTKKKVVVNDAPEVVSCEAEKYLSSNPQVVPKVNKEAKVKSDDPVTKYQGITLNFGKYSGKQLKDLVDVDPKYLQWLKKRFSSNQDLTPTQHAIVKYIQAMNL